MKSDKTGGTIITFYFFLSYLFYNFTISNYKIIKNMLKAIAIIRTSTDRQEIESQREQVLQMCYGDGLTNDEVVIIGEQGASAIKLDEAYLRNMNQIYELLSTTPSIQTIYAWGIDRIGRDEEFLMKFKNTLIKKKIQLVIKNPSLRLLNDDGSVNSGIELAFALFVTMAKQEMEHKKARFKRAKERNQKQGKYNGGPYVMMGYKVDDNGYYVPNEEEVEIVKEIFEEYASGKWSLRKLCVEIMNRGYERNGSKIAFGTIKTILYNGPKYCGIDRHIAYPPILTEDIVNKVNERLKNNRAIQKSSIHHYFGHKIMKCPCGQTLRAYNNHYKCASKTTDYRKLTGKLVPCKFDHNNVSLAVMDGILWRIARDCHYRVLEEMNGEKKKELKKEKKILEKKIAKFEKDLEGFDEKRTKLFERSILEGISDDVVANIKMKIDNQENKIRVEYNECNEKLSRINASLNIGTNKQRDNEIRFLTMINMEMNATEQEMNDLVHRYITNGIIRKYEGEPLKEYEGWKTSEIVIDTIFGQRKFMYFPYAKKQKNVFEWDNEENNWDWFVYEDMIRDKQGYKLVLREYEED